MKHSTFILMLFVAGACHHRMDPWPTEGDKQEVAIYLQTRSLSASSFSNYQLFVYDESNGQMSRYTATTDPQDNNLLHARLFPGNYTGYCVTNAEEAESYEYAENNPPQKTYLKAQRSSDGKEEAKDFLLGESRFQVTAHQNNHTVFNLERKVGMLRIIIGNIPEWLDDLEIRLTHAPTKMNLLGEYSTEDYTIVKKITPPTNGTSTTTLLLFPPQTPSVLTLTSSSSAFTTPERTIPSILANKVTEITANFRHPEDLSFLDITTQQSDWDPELLSGEEWSLDLPDSPCQGEGNGLNLLINGSFEDGFTENCPTGWKLSKDGADKKVVEVTTPAFDGNKAIRLEGKTQLYQEISVNSGLCYQLKMYINAPISNAKWRYWITWTKGKTDLSAGALHPTGYQKQTDGYIEAFSGLVIRAPREATGLRIEIRNYSELSAGEGIYVDKVSVEVVD